MFLEINHVNLNFQTSVVNLTIFDGCTMCLYCIFQFSEIIFFSFSCTTHNKTKTFRKIKTLLECPQEWNLPKTLFFFVISPNFYCTYLQHANMIIPNKTRWDVNAQIRNWNSSTQNSVIHTIIKLDNISFSGNRNNLTFGWVVMKVPHFTPVVKRIKFVGWMQ